MSSPASGSDSPSSSFELLDRRVQRWVYDNQWRDLHDIQERSIPPILEGGSDLIIAASTAAGKTEAAFLPITSALCSLPPQVGLGALYISPLKALINDQHQRLEPLCERAGIEVAGWHGDISATVKRRVREGPSGILLITPESIESIFVNYGTSAPRIFGALRYVVIDELHAFIGSERGRQLQSLLHRIELAGRRSPMRIGLSATLGEIGIAAEYMRPGGGEGVGVIESEGGKRELRVQLRGYRAVELDQEASTEAPDPDREQIASHLYEHLRGHDNLVFANSRASVEEFADLLRRRSESERVPVEFFPHHGNLSKGLREEVEEHLRNPSSPTTAICTSTLELGIDVGSVTCVGQIDPPFSAAALRQRLGRSGRKPGDPSILRMYVTESELEPGASPHEELREGLVQSIALIEALIDGWVEPPLDDALHLSTLIQQVLSVIAQHGGARAAQIWDALCGDGPFDLDREAFVVLLRGLVEREVIGQTGDGDLHLATVGESLVNHYSFFSAFMTAEEYRLVHEGREIGSMPVYSPLTEESFLIFAGRRWQVVGVEDDRRVITVVRAKGGRVPRFIGGGGLIHDEIRRRMRELYESERVPGFLDESARELLAEGRAAFRALGLGERELVPYDAGSAYFPWRGDRVISTLALGARSAGRHVEASGLALLAPHASPEELHETLSEVFGLGTSPDPLALMEGVKNLETEKHHWMLDRGLLLQDAAIGRLDVEGAAQSVASIPAPSAAAANLPDGAPHRAPEFLVVDCETTGLHPSAQHRIVELAMVVVDVEGNVGERWSSLLQPDRDLGAGQIHGIRARELTKAPRFAEIAGEVTERLAGRTLVAHNARFDKAFLESELTRAEIDAPPIPYICTMELASRLQIGGTRRRLTDCRGELGLPATHDHEALADAEACAEVLRRYLVRNGEATLGLATGPLHPAEKWPKVEARAPSVQREPAFSGPVEPGALSQLMTEAPPPAGHEGADASAYLEALERAIEDRHLDSAEREELAQTAQMLGIDSEQLMQINRAYIGQLVDLAWRDGAVTGREREDLYLVSCALGVEDTAQLLREPPSEPSGGGQSSDTGFALQGKSVCFTGELLCNFEGERMTRETAARLATSAGLAVLPRVTKKLDLLVLADPDSNSGKAQKAREYGTRLIAETAFWAMIGVEVS